MSLMIPYKSDGPKRDAAPGSAMLVTAFSRCTDRRASRAHGSQPRVSLHQPLGAERFALDHGRKGDIIDFGGYAVKISNVPFSARPLFCPNDQVRV